MTVSNYLSIWEVSHRWHDVSPDDTDPEKLPTNIQDTIRYICRGILDQGIGILVVASSPTDDDQFSHIFLNAPLTKVREILPEIENCLSRKYDKSVLDSCFIECENLFDYCLHEQAKKSGISVQLDFPSCWWPLIDTGASLESVEPDGSDSSPAHLKPSTLRPSVVHKLICQGIAKTLWDIHPKMTIAAMTEHKAIQEYGYGKFYKGKNTLREWISEIAPENKRKPGRPKSDKPGSDAA